MTISDVVFKYIEFFFSKKDLDSMFKIKPLSQHVWLEAVHSLYSVDPNDPNIPNEKKPEKDEFHYNIMHTDAYKGIMECLKKIKGIMIESDRDPSNKKQQIQIEYNKIDELCKDLYYYEERYVYAHYIFNNIRTNGIKIKGGGIKHVKDMTDMTIEDFKEIIRQKIKELDIQELQ